MWQWPWENCHCWCSCWKPPTAWHRKGPPSWFLFSCSLQSTGTRLMSLPLDKSVSYMRKCQCRCVATIDSKRRLQLASSLIPCAWLKRPQGPGFQSGLHSLPTQPHWSVWELNSEFCLDQNPLCLTWPETSEVTSESELFASPTRCPKGSKGPYLWWVLMEHFFTLFVQVLVRCP